MLIIWSLLHEIVTQSLPLLQKIRSLESKRFSLEKEVREKKKKGFWFCNCYLLIHLWSNLLMKIHSRDFQAFPCSQHKLLEAEAQDWPTKAFDHLSARSIEKVKAWWNLMFEKEKKQNDDLMMVIFLCLRLDFSFTQFRKKQCSWRWLLVFSNGPNCSRFKNSMYVLYRNLLPIVIGKGDSLISLVGTLGERWVSV